MKPLLLVILVTGTLAAQPRGGGYYKHNVSGALGAGLPRGELQPFFEDSFGLNINYGYRFHRYFQLDLGMDTVFHACPSNTAAPS